MIFGRVHMTAKGINAAIIPLARMLNGSSAKARSNSNPQSHLQPTSGFNKWAHRFRHFESRGLSVCAFSHALVMKALAHENAEKLRFFPHG
jgi:hypothetical protein